MRVKNRVSGVGGRVWGEGRRSQSICTKIPHQFKYSTAEKTNNKPPEFVLG
jgi:hypothetical protein